VRRFNKLYALAENKIKAFIAAVMTDARGKK
jgi:hypothetical protein